MSDERRLIDWLEDHDEACPACGYSLLKLREPMCPECAAPLTLGVASPHASPGPWALAVISFAMGLGFDAVVTFFLTAAIVLFAGPPPLFPQGLMYLGFVGLTAAMVAGLIWTIRHRSAWSRQPRARQWRISRMIFLVIGVVHASFGLLLAIVFN